MLIMEQWGIENGQFWHNLMLIIRTHSGNCKIFVSPGSQKHPLINNLYIVSDTNKHLKFDSDRKLLTLLIENLNQIAWHGHQTAKSKSPQYICYFFHLFNFQQ